jgi:hypothetical protein
MRFAKPLRKTILSSVDWGAKDKALAVSLIQLTSGNWRVLVWEGAFGVERDFEQHTGREAAHNLYDKIVDYTTTQELADWGMWLS